MDGMAQSSQELRKQLDHTMKLVSETVEAIDRNPQVLMPRGPDTAQADAAQAEASIPVDVRRLLESLMARDQLLIQELLRLQRSLSRQNFRGAESARRLVRRLARKAQQGIADIQAMIGPDTTTAESPVGRDLALTLERIRRQLRRLKNLEVKADSPGPQPE